MALSETEERVVDPPPSRASLGIGGAETARRAARLLEVVAGEQGPVTLEQVVDRVGLPKSITYRLLRALQDEGWLERRGRSGYGIGGRLVRLAATVDTGRDLAERSRPLLGALSAATSETCTLHVLDGDSLVLAAGAESRAHALQLRALVGERTPLFRGCAGLVILAQLDASERERTLGRLATANPTATSEIRSLDGPLRDAARAGYAISFGENHPGVAGVAAPVTGPLGVTVASIAVSGPDGRWTRPAMEDALPLLLGTCAELTARLSGDLRVAEATTTRGIENWTDE